jgi:polyferredoxin
MNDNNNQNLTQLTEWESKRDYRWKWMWISLIAFFISPAVFRWWAEFTDKVEILVVVFFYGGMLGITLISIILFFVCLIGWILARNEYKKLSGEQESLERERERERE